MQQCHRMALCNDQRDWDRVIKRCGNYKTYNTCKAPRDSSSITGQAYDLWHNAVAIPNDIPLLAPSTWQEELPISLGGKSALQPNKASPPASFQLSRKIKAFHRLHFSSLSSFINVFNPTSLSALADNVYHLDRYRSTTAWREYFRVSDAANSRCQHGKIGTQAAGILTPTYLGQGPMAIARKRISYLHCAWNGGRSSSHHL